MNDDKKFAAPVGDVPWKVYRVSTDGKTREYTGLTIMEHTAYEALQEAGRRLGETNLAELDLEQQEPEPVERQPLTAEDKYKGLRPKGKRPKGKQPTQAQLKREAEHVNRDFTVAFTMRATVSPGRNRAELCRIIREGVDHAMAQSRLLARPEMDITTICVAEDCPTGKKGKLKR